MVSKERIEELKEKSRQNEIKVLEFMKNKKGGGVTAKEVANEFKLSLKRAGQILIGLHVQVRNVRVVESEEGEDIYYLKE